MRDYNDDILVGVDQTVYARFLVYNRLTKSDRGTRQFQPILTVKGVTVPPIRELIWFKFNIYLAVTVDGDLFSFKSGELLTLESPIISAHPIERDWMTFLLVLLENGRLRLIYYRRDKRQGTSKLINVNSEIIDRTITENVVILSSIHTSLPSPNGYNTSVTPSGKSIIVTSNGRIKLIMIDRTSYGGFDQYCLRISVDIDAENNIDYRNILVIRNGYILLRDSTIYQIRINRQAHRSRNYYKQIEHQVSGIVDILPQLNDKLVVLTEANRIWILRPNMADQEVTNPDLEVIKSIELLTHRYHNGIEVRMDTDSTYILGIDGGIYRLDDDGQTQDQAIPGQLLAQNSRMVKSARLN